MARPQSTRFFLEQAVEEEKKYNWLEAIVFYKKNLNRMLTQKEFFQASRIKERIGCFAAFGVFRISKSKQL